MDELLVILVVEDEAIIRDVVEETLDDGGFKVVLATSGEEAVKLLDSAKPNYRALVTDINLAQKRHDRLGCSAACQIDLSRIGRGLHDW